MTASATSRLALSSLLFVALLAFGTRDSLGQNEPLGDEFIFFAEGSHVLIPEFGATVVTDPTDPANKVAQFAFGNWTAPGWRWQVDGNPAVDASANVSETVGEGDTLYFRIWVDAANAGQAGVSLTFFDSIDETAPDLADKDVEFRATWWLPEWIRDGQWHDVALPLPPSTTDALDSAKVGKNVDGTALTVAADTLLKYWDYPGGWVGSVNTFVDRNHPQYLDFGWTDLRGLAVFWDNAPPTPGGNILLDDVYIGGPTTDISRAQSAPPAMGAVSVAADGSDYVISWTLMQDVDGYKVYVSDQPINSVGKTAAGEVVPIATVTPPTSEVRHGPEFPHASLCCTLYYAVTTSNLWGFENLDVSASATEGTNMDATVAPFITMLTATEGEELFNNVQSDVVAPGALAAWRPFEVNSAHSKGADGGLPEGGDADNSAKLWMGIYYDASQEINEMYIYAEVTDDENAFAPNMVDPGDPASCLGNVCGNTHWSHDSIEMNWGSYDVPWLVGSTHSNIENDPLARGATPDHQLRISLVDDGAGGVANDLVTPGPGGALWEFPSHPSGAPIATGGIVSDVLTDGANVTGYKFLAVVPFEGIVNPSPEQGMTPDAVFIPPASNEMRIVPFNILVNDRDAGNARETQMSWSIKPNVNNFAWSTPTQWTVTAVAGRDLAVSIEDEAGELPGEFALDQNYPNPFNPSTSIRFSLATAENVTLKVYDVLGREVATLVDNKKMSAGKYSASFDAANLASGMYLYRLKAGSAFIETKSMVLLK